MAKPFSIQSPEDIAKEYGGNKQKIAQAMQMGIVDPTAGTLAGMFIDRMRAAQMQESANPPTIVQQVMGAPPAMAAAGAMGNKMQEHAVPGAPPVKPMVPPMAGAIGNAMQEQASMGPGGDIPGMANGGSAYAAPYAQGGLDGLPVPDTMFDEPSNGGFNDGYAGGGLIAFADGGSTDDDFEAFKRAIIAQESGGNYAAYNPQSGASGLVQFMPDTARRLAARMGMDYSPALLRSNAPAAKQYQDRLANAQLKEAWDYGGGDPAKAAAYHFAGPDTSGWKSKTRQYQSDILQRMGKTPGTSSSSDSGEATRASYSKDLEAMAKRFAPNEAPRDTYIAQLSKLMSPETKAAEHKQAVWAAVGDFARALGSTPGSLLMGISAGVSSAAAGAAERKAAEKNRLLALSKEIADQYDLRQKAVFEGLKDANSVVKDMYQAGASTDRIDAYLQKAQMAADAAGKKGEATQAAKQANTLRKQALDYQNKALAADKELAKLSSRLIGNPAVAKQQADKVAALIHAMSLANNQLKQMGDPGITWDPNAFTNYNAFAHQQGSWFHAPEQGDQQAAPTGQPAPQSGNSALFSQADAILGAQ